MPPAVVPAPPAAPAGSPRRASSQPARPRTPSGVAAGRRWTCCSASRAWAVAPGAHEQPGLGLQGQRAPGAADGDQPGQAALDGGGVAVIDLVSAPTAGRRGRAAAGRRWCRRRPGRSAASAAGQVAGGDQQGGGAQPGEGAVAFWGRGGQVVELGECLAPGWRVRIEAGGGGGGLSHGIEELCGDLGRLRRLPPAPGLPAADPGEHQHERRDQQEAVALQQRLGPFGPQVLIDLVEDVYHTGSRWEFGRTIATGAGQGKPRDPASDGRGGDTFFIFGCFDAACAGCC